MKPEDYWINRGSDLIGLDVLAEGVNARQADTYTAIAKECMGYYVLDIGCNVGALEMFIQLEYQKYGIPLWLFKKVGMDCLYHGIDSNPHAIDYLKNKGISCQLGSLPNISVKHVEGVTLAPRFHVVVIKDVLEHLGDYSYCREVIKIPSQKLIISFFMAPTNKLASVEKTEAGYYHNKYNEKDFVTFIHSNGFTIEKQIDTWETGSLNLNRTYVFKRNP